MVALVVGITFLLLRSSPLPDQAEGSPRGQTAEMVRGTQSERRAINLPGRTTLAPFSDAILAGDTLYLSG